MKGPIDFSQVKDRFPMEHFFEYILGAPPGAKQGRYSICPECGPSSDNNKVLVSKNSYFTCFKCGAKGDVIEAAKLLYKTNTKGAVDILMGQNNASPSSKPSKPKVPYKPSAPNEALLEFIAFLSQVAVKPDPSHIQYLEGRGISNKTMSFAIDAGMLRFLPFADNHENFAWLTENIGLEKLRAAGLVKPDKNFASIAYRPLVFISEDKQSAEFRIIRPAKEGEPKTICYGLGSHRYYLPQRRDHVVVCEGPIDMLSAYELGLTGNILGLRGVANWQIDWFTQFNQVILALDHDEAGIAQTAILQEKLAEKKIQVFQFGFTGKDLNEYLLNKNKV